MYLERYIREIRTFCERNKVKTLYVFGSVLTDRFTDKSDIDLIVDIDNKSGIKNDIDGFIDLSFDYLNSDGELIGLIQANDLVNWIEKNPEKFNGLDPELQKLTNIKMEDNPIIVIAKLKR